MRSIKMGIIAIFALIFALACELALPVNDTWSFTDYSKSVAGVISMLAAFTCITVCAITPVRKEESEDKKETPE